MPIVPIAKGAHAMTSKTLQSAAVASIFSWRLVMGQLIVPVLTWGGFAVAVPLLQQLGFTRLPGVEQMVNWAYWGNVALTAACLVIASVRSVLPAAMACVAVIPLYFAGYPDAAAWAPLIGLAACLLYAMGFAFRAGQVGLAGRT